MKIDQRELYVPGNMLGTLIKCNGYYDRPQPGHPLVGYAGTYKTGDPAIPTKHYVGYKYFNCAKLEQYPVVMSELAFTQKKLWNWEKPDVILGAPMGGILWADSLASVFECRVVFAEKETLAKAKVVDERDTTRLILDRHEIEPGDKVVICEDICNNFSTTHELIELIRSCGAIPYAISCIINRSGQPHYQIGEIIIPLSACAHIPTEQFRQDDSAVAGDVATSNIIWKPKSRENWAKLTSLMKT